MVEVIHLQHLNSLPRPRKTSEILADVMTGSIPQAPPPPSDGPAILVLDDQQTRPTVRVELNPPLYAKYSTQVQVHANISEELKDRLEKRNKKPTV